MPGSLILTPGQLDPISLKLNYTRRCLLMCDITAPNAATPNVFTSVGCWA